jgi:hypothetical protein
MLSVSRMDFRGIYCADSVISFISSSSKTTVWALSRKWLK